MYLSDDGDGDGAGARMNVYNSDFSDFEYGDGDQLSSSGNFAQDPLLTGARRLAAGSPCIDTGLATAPSVPAVDFEGDARTGNPDISADGREVKSLDNSPVRGQRWNAVFSPPPQAARGISEAFSSRAFRLRYRELAARQELAAAGSTSG